MAYAKVISVSGLVLCCLLTDAPPYTEGMRKSYYNVGAYIEWCAYVLSDTVTVSRLSLATCSSRSNIRPTDQLECTDPTRSDSQCRAHPIASVLTVPLALALLALP